jgi:hypothetical protein
MVPKTGWLFRRESFIATGAVDRAIFLARQPAMPNHEVDFSTTGLKSRRWSGAVSIKRVSPA